MTDQSAKLQDEHSHHSESEEPRDDRERNAADEEATQNAITTEARAESGSHENAGEVEERIASESNDTAEEAEGRKQKIEAEDGEEEVEVEEDDDDDDDDDDEEEEEEEPRLKYARLTQNLSSVYRNGDATSAFLVAGDKMVRSNHSS